MHYITHRYLDIAAILATILVPMYLNPLGDNPIEVSRVLFFRWIVLGMIIVAIIQLLHLWRNHTEESSVVCMILLLIKQSKLSNPLLVPTLVLVGVTLLSTFYSINRWMSFWGMDSARGVITTLHVVVFFFIISSRRHSWYQVESLITAILIGSVPITIYGWIQYLGWDFIDWPLEYSVSPVQSTLGRSILLGGYLAIVLPFSIAGTFKLIFEKNRRWISYSVLVLLQVGCLLFTLARGAWLGFIGGVIVFILMFAKHRHQVIIWSIVGLTILLGTFVFIFIYTQGTRIFPSAANPVSIEFLQQYRSGSNMIRLKTLYNALDMIPERLWLGYGPSTFPLAYANHYPRDPIPGYSFIRMFDPHNLIIYELISGGLIGLFTLLWLLERYYSLLFSTLKPQMNIRHRIIFAALGGSMTAYLIQAQFNPNTIVFVVYFWLILALGVVTSRLSINS